MTLRSALLSLVLGALAISTARLAAETPQPPPTAAAPYGAAAGDLLALARVAPRPRAASEPSCTPDRAHCIAAASYIGDVCRTIEETAEAQALDPHFFARLLWRESLFEADAVSPAGAIGIAQFMPGTAALRGLVDPFNPAEALQASAAYLSDLARAYGNIGLAAVAYNGGEARAERFIAKAGGLPLETRAYVVAITGLSAETWRDTAPPSVDLALPGGAFQPACVAHAAARSLRDLDDAPPLLPWGVIVASNRDRAGAERQVARLQNRHAAVLGGEPVAYARTRRPGMRTSLYAAQIGRDSRTEADALCARLRAAGGDCMVLRN